MNDPIESHWNVSKNETAELYSSLDGSFCCKATVKLVIIRQPLFFVSWNIFRKIIKRTATFSFWQKRKSFLTHFVIRIFGQSWLLQKLKRSRNIEKEALAYSNQKVESEYVCACTSFEYGNHQLPFQVMYPTIGVSHGNQNCLSSSSKEGWKENKQKIWKMMFLLNLYSIRYLLSVFLQRMELLWHNPLCSQERFHKTLGNSHHS